MKYFRVVGSDSHDVSELHSLRSLPVWLREILLQEAVVWASYTRAFLPQWLAPIVALRAFFFVGATDPEERIRIIRLNIGFDQ